MMGDNQKEIHIAQQVKRISLVQQRKIHWTTLEIVDNPPEGADQVSGGLESRVLWDEGRPLADQPHPESPQALTAQAHGLSPGTAWASVASLSEGLQNTVRRQMCGESISGILLVGAVSSRGLDATHLSGLESGSTKVFAVASAGPDSGGIRNWGHVWVNSWSLTRGSWTCGSTPGG